jgi:hypothetical protein
MGCANRCRASERSHGICANKFDATDLSADHHNTEYVATGRSVCYGLAEPSVRLGQRDSIASEHNLYHRDRSAKYVAAGGTSPDGEPAEFCASGNHNIYDDDANHRTTVLATR